MRIGVGLCFYEDLESLKRCLPILSPNVDYIFAIDGRFSLLEGNDFSTQETIDYVKSFPNVIYEQFIGMEHEKRDRYVRLASQYDCDVLFIHDSDEFILDATDWVLFRESIEEQVNKYANQRYFAVDMLYTPPSFYPPEYTPIPKIWSHPEELEYFKTHNMFRNKITGEIVKSSGYVPRIEGMKMAWGDDLRSQEYLEKVCKYQGKMLEYEIPIRDEYRKY